MKQGKGTTLGKVWVWMGEEEETMWPQEDDGGSFVLFS